MKSQDQRGLRILYAGIIGFVAAPCLGVIYLFPHEGVVRVLLRNHPAAEGEAMKRIVAVACATIVTLVVALLGMVPFTLLLIHIVQPNNFQGPPVHGLVLSLPLGVFCGYMVFRGIVK